MQQENRAQNEEQLFHSLQFRLHIQPVLVAARTSHRHNLLGASRMNGNDRVQLSFRNAQFHSQAPPLPHFIHRNTEQMNANNFLVGFDSDDFHQRWRLALGHGVVHVGES